MSTPHDIDQRPITIIGGGTLGRRIALMFLTRGGVVRINDTDESVLEAARAFIDEQLPGWLEVRAQADDAPDDVAAGTVETTTDMKEAVKDSWLIVEAVPEVPELKRTILGQLDAAAADDAIVATNSSSYRSDLLIDNVTAPERVMNMHFQMPPQALAVELMTDGQTDEDLLDVAAAQLKTYGLFPFIARKPSTGLIANRIWAAIKRESLAVVAEGVATPQDVDQLFKIMLHTAFGPFEMMDKVGLDVVLAIEENYVSENPNLPEGPRELLHRYIDAGKLGEKSGEGFYEHS